jgi:hypothetical protein
MRAGDRSAAGTLQSALALSEAGEKSLKILECLFNPIESYLWWIAVTRAAEMMRGNYIRSSPQTLWLLDSFADTLTGTMGMLLMQNVYHQTWAENCWQATELQQRTTALGDIIRTANTNEDEKTEATVLEPVVNVKTLQASFNCAEVLPKDSIMFESTLQKALRDQTAWTNMIDISDYFKSITLEDQRFAYTMPQDLKTDLRFQTDYMANTALLGLTELSETFATQLQREMHTGLKDKTDPVVSWNYVMRLGLFGFTWSYPDTCSEFPTEKGFAFKVENWVHYLRNVSDDRKPLSTTFCCIRMASPSMLIGWTIARPTVQLSHWVSNQICLRNRSSRANDLDLIKPIEKVISQLIKDLETVNFNDWQNVSYKGNYAMLIGRYALVLSSLIRMNWGTSKADDGYHQHGGNQLKLANCEVKGIDKYLWEKLDTPSYCRTRNRIVDICQSKDIDAATVNMAGWVRSNFDLDSGTVSFGSSMLRFMGDVHIGIRSLALINEDQDYLIESAITRFIVLLRTPMLGFELHMPDCSMSQVYNYLVLDRCQEGFMELIRLTLDISGGKSLDARRTTPLEYLFKSLSLSGNSLDDPIRDLANNLLRASERAAEARVHKEEMTMLLTDQLSVRGVGEIERHHLTKMCVNKANLSLLDFSKVHSQFRPTFLKTGRVSTALFPRTRKRVPSILVSKNAIKKFLKEARSGLRKEIVKCLQHECFVKPSTLTELDDSTLLESEGFPIITFVINAPNELQYKPKISEAECEGRAIMTKLQRDSMHVMIDPEESGIDLWRKVASRRIEGECILRQYQVNEKTRAAAEALPPSVRAYNNAEISDAEQDCDDKTKSKPTRQMKFSDKVREWLMYAWECCSSIFSKTCQLLCGNSRFFKGEDRRKEEGIYGDNRSINPNKKPLLRCTCIPVSYLADINLEYEEEAISQRKNTTKSSHHSQNIPTATDGTANSDNDESSENEHEEVCTMSSSCLQVYYAIVNVLGSCIHACKLHDWSFCIGKREKGNDQTNNQTNSPNENDHNKNDSNGNLDFNFKNIKSCAYRTNFKWAETDEARIARETHRHVQPTRLSDEISVVSTETEEQTRVSHIHDTINDDAFLLANPEISGIDSGPETKAMTKQRIEAESMNNDRNHHDHDENQSKSSGIANYTAAIFGIDADFNYLITFMRESVDNFLWFAKPAGSVSNEREETHSPTMHNNFDRSRRSCELETSAANLKGCSSTSMDAEFFMIGSDQPRSANSETSSETSEEDCISINKKDREGEKLIWNCTSIIGISCDYLKRCFNGVYQLFRRIITWLRSKLEVMRSSSVNCRIIHRTLANIPEVEANICELDTNFMRDHCRFFWRVRNNRCNKWNAAALETTVYAPVSYTVELLMAMRPKSQ